MNPSTVPLPKPALIDKDLAEQARPGHVAKALAAIDFQLRGVWYKPHAGATVIIAKAGTIRKRSWVTKSLGSAGNREID